jgi:hypothetical protein
MGHLVLAWEDAPARDPVKYGARVAAWDEHAFALSGRVSPLDSYSMSGVFARDSKQRRHATRANLFQANQADANNGVTTMEFGMERRGKETLHNFWLRTKVDQQPPFDNTGNNWNPKGHRPDQA